MPTDSLESLPDLWKETYDLVAQVPIGHVTTYGAVATGLGDIVASRFVGLAMSRNDDIVRVPCRRVVQSDGRVGGYTGGGPERKIKLLKGEGIPISGDRVVDLEKYLFNEFETSYPLKDLRERQRAMKKHLNTRPMKGDVRQVAGIDVAYKGEHGFAAMVVFDYESGEEIERFSAEGDASFPYVPTYLAFREAPLIKPLLKRVRRGTVLMYDGNGVLHPDGFGIASHIGVAFDVPVVGVAKKLLCGAPAGKWKGNAQEILLAGMPVGHVLARNRPEGGVYVSVGHGLSPAQALRIARRFLLHKVPEPTRQAHLAAEMARC